MCRGRPACNRWRELAWADWVGRAGFGRDGLVEKAGVFEVAMPAVEGGGEGGGLSSSAAAASERDELAGVGLAFYARVFALEVRGTTQVARSGEPRRSRYAMHGRAVYARLGARGCCAGGAVGRCITQGRCANTGTYTHLTLLTIYSV